LFCSRFGTCVFHLKVKTYPNTIKKCPYFATVFGQVFVKPSNQNEKSIDLREPCMADRNKT